MITNMKFDPEQFKRLVKSVLDPQEYQKWYQKIQEPGPKDHSCLVEAFFRKEEEKPMELRQKFCMISCNCYKCVPYHM